jgi:tRNA pseudouridine38-40 synthase
VRVIGSGRTDAGVHALAQVAHASIRSRIPLGHLQRGLNALLRPHIVVTGIEEARAGFHARYDARRKRYRYRIINAPTVLPFERRYVHHVTTPLNAAVMKREAQALRGRHDFAPFAKQGPPSRTALLPVRFGEASAKLAHDSARAKQGSPVKDTRRTVTEVRLIRRAGGLLEFEIEADGFLYGMVRRIVGTLLDIGRDVRSPGTIADILRTKCARLVGPTAPARGLCLVRVQYSR